MKTYYGLAATLGLLLGGAACRSEEAPASKAAPTGTVTDCGSSAACPAKCKTYLPRGFDWLVGQVPARPWCGLRTFGGGMCTEWFTYCPAGGWCQGPCSNANPCCNPPLYAFFLYPAARASIQQAGPAYPPLGGPAPANGTAVKPVAAAGDGGRQGPEGNAAESKKQ
jgi:hypothetical protein